MKLKIVLLYAALLGCLFSSCAYRSPLEPSDTTTPVSSDITENTAESTAAPTEIPASTGIMTIAAGDSHTLAIQQDGSLWAWGSNRYGQLGNGTTESSFTPVKIMDSVTSVAAGDYHSLAIQEDGSLWAWGHNYSGQLGNGTTQDSLIPVKVMDSVASASAGNSFTMAIKTDGTLWAWGDNYNGTLGDGTVSIRWDKTRPDEDHDKHTPVKIMDSVVFVTTGSAHTLAIKEDGSLWAWGSDYYGVLGTVKSPSHLPATIMDSVVSAAASKYTSMAIKADGSLWVWGDRAGSTPTQKMDSVAAASAGSDHNMVIKEDGSLWAWGNNFKGALGNSTVEDKELSTPIKVMDSIVSVAAGRDFTLALMSDGTLWSWGANHGGQLGIEIHHDNHTITFHNCRAPVQMMQGVKGESTAAPDTLQPSGPTAQLDSVHALAAELASLKLPPECEVYRSILYDYAMLEKSGFTFYCTDIGDSVLAYQGGSTYNMGWSTTPKLVYALHDINNDGMPELLIGCRSPKENSGGELTGIYSVQDGRPMSVMQGEDRFFFQLLADSDGNCVIGHAFGRMGSAVESFYTLDQDGALITLDSVFIDGYEFDDNGEIVGYLISREVNGEAIPMSQDAYESLMVHYGIWGYGMINREGENRAIELAWQPILGE